MIRILALIACLAPAAAFAQANAGPPADMGAAHRMMHGQPMMTPGQQMTHGQMMQGRHMMPAHMMGGQQPSGAFATQPGQGAFAAIQEIVEILAADPKTDWSKVNIDALRQHLIDMNNVTLGANAKNESIDGGMRFDVTGEGPVRDSIRRMTAAHAATMNGVDGWKFEATEIEGGASLTVHSPAKDIDKLHGLGFFGVLTLGMHHQMHHLMIAREENPHG
jgi:hypothetical protein